MVSVENSSPRNHILIWVQKFLLELGIILHTFDLCTGEAEAGEFLSVQGQPALNGKFQANQSYVVRPYLLLEQNHVDIRKMETCSIIVNTVEKL